MVRSNGVSNWHCAKFTTDSSVSGNRRTQAWLLNRFAPFSNKKVGAPRRLAPFSECETKHSYLQSKSYDDSSKLRKIKYCFVCTASNIMVGVHPTSDTIFVNLCLCHHPPAPHNNMTMNTTTRETPLGYNVMDAVDCLHCHFNRKQYGPVKFIR